MASPEEQKEAAKDIGITYPLFLWEREKLPKPLQVVFVHSTTLLIDRKGKIRKVVFGIVFGERKDDLERDLIASLKEKHNDKGS